MKSNKSTTIHIQEERQTSISMDLASIAPPPGAGPSSANPQTQQAPPEPSPQHALPGFTVPPAVEAAEMPQQRQTWQSAASEASNHPLSRHKKVPKLLTIFNVSVSLIGLVVQIFSGSIIYVFGKTSARQADASLAATLWRDCVDLQVLPLLVAMRQSTLTHRIGSSWRLPFLSRNSWQRI